MWLRDVSDAHELPSPIPLPSILANSCYYPASGLDASPVIILNGFIHSFVYADYGIKRDDYLREIAQTGFRGYTMILSRDVERPEIVPSTWQPQMPRYYDEVRGMERLLDAQRQCVPFGHWSIWKRREGLDEHSGPAIFSLFFLAGEGVAILQGLYERNRVSPLAMAVIQPGHAFGNNWTNFFNDDGPLWTSVGASGLYPEHLLIGNFGESRERTPDCPYPDYTFVKRTHTREGRTTHTIDMFRRNRKTEPSPAPYSSPAAGSESGEA